MADRSRNEVEWHSDGLQFECTQCGNCCTGPAGYVRFTSDEGVAMAQVKGIAVDEFYKRYARPDGNGHSLTEHKTEHGYDCVFLDRSTVPGKAICSMYEARPAQCKTWPFWAENLGSKRSWEAVKRATPCPGMGHGTLVPIEQIRIQRDSL